MSPPLSSASALSPEYALLGLLAQGPAHGYELHQRLVQDLGQIWRLSLSQTYNILHRLEGRSFVTAKVQAQAKLPARHRYRLTPAGRRRFTRWLQSPSGHSARAIRVEFITRLYFAQARGPEMVQALIEAQAVETQQGVERLQAQLKQLPYDQAFNRLGLELRIRQLTSILDWLEHCRRTLLTPAPELSKGSP